MLRVKPPWSASARLLDDRDRGAVLAICDRDPVTNVFVSSRVRTLGLEPGRLGAQMWGHGPGGRLASLCYSGANLVPVAATPDAVAAFAERALRQGRRCSSVVGPAAEVQALWALLRRQWGPARELRPVQPVMVTRGPPPVPPDPLVRRVRMDEIDILWPACVAMFTEEVGVSPTAGDGGASYRARLQQLIRTGRAFARIEGRRVIFKAEIGAVTPLACQVQGVWVRPERRGQGLAAPGMAAVVAEATRVIAPLVSLYVNDFNRPARAAYRRAGFTETGRFMSVLFLGRQFLGRQSRPRIVRR
jgi:predicted GNAT family acetyltransferase